jgi:hypothetical protein
LAALEQRRRGWDRPYTENDVLQFLRHEMGHVVSYAYRLYARQDWRERFGDFWRPYPEDDYPFNPQSQDFVRHLMWPEFYAQKHPDEDWAETFAVWMTPDWRAEYRDWPLALAKLEYCAQVVAELASRPVPETTVVADDEAYTCVPEGWYTDVRPAGLQCSSSPPA